MGELSYNKKVIFKPRLGTYLVLCGKNRGKDVSPLNNVEPRRGTYLVGEGNTKGKRCVPDRIYKQDRVIMKEV